MLTNGTLSWNCPKPVFRIFGILFWKPWFILSVPKAIFQKGSFWLLSSSLLEYIKIELENVSKCPLWVLLLLVSWWGPCTRIFICLLICVELFTVRPMPHLPSFPTNSMLWENLTCFYLEPSVKEPLFPGEKRERREGERENSQVACWH